jgi:hypothetical protein
MNKEKMPSVKAREFSFNDPVAFILTTDNWLFKSDEQVTAEDFVSFTKRSRMVALNDANFSHELRRCLFSVFDDDEMNTPNYPAIIGFFDTLTQYDRGGECEARLANIRSKLSEKVKGLN